MAHLYHVRRMFGGSLAQAWLNAAVALQFVDGVPEAYGAARKEVEILFRLLDRQQAFRVERIPNSTHIVRLHVADTNLEEFRDRLRQRNILLPPVVPGQGRLALKINPSLRRSCAQDLADAFLAAV